MSSKKLVLVVGAGASQEARLPTGYELRGRIASILGFKFDDHDRQVLGDRMVREALVLTVNKSSGEADELGRYYKAAKLISNSMPLATSIDSFIHMHRQNRELELCGKLAIVRSLLQAEQQSPMMVDQSNSRNTLDCSLLADTWFIPLFQLLTRDCSLPELPDRLGSVVLVVFNYDRCIEHFLHETLKITYGLSTEEAAKLLSHLRIYHPYGVVGSLPWQGMKPAVPFGGEPNAHSLLELASTIRTFTEGTDPVASEVEDIRKHVANATHLVFLGFAFHELNLALLRPHGGSVHPNDVRIIATGHGMSEPNRDATKDELNEVFASPCGDNARIELQLRCSSLIRDYWKQLA